MSCSSRIILIFLIYKYVLPPINKAMEDRQEKIRDSLEAADQARADAEAADDERRSVLEEARQQAREIVATANRTAEQVRTDAQARGQREYERIVGNADVEIALARQRAVEEAAARMGEIVMDVVERVIGREVERRGAPRPDRRGGRRRCGPTRAAARPPAPGPGSEPSPSGVHGRGRRGGRTGRARRHRRPTSRRSSSWCWPTRSCGPR